MRRAIALVALAGASLLVAGCGGGGGGGGDVPAPAASATVGPTGGTVNGPSGASVVVPAAALAADATIGVEQTAAGAPLLPAGAKALGPVFAFTPHGTHFALPVTVTVPFDASAVPPGAKVVLVKTDDTQTGWEVIGGTTVSGNFSPARPIRSNR
jgi:hypothetical protein